MVCLILIGVVLLLPASVLADAEDVEITAQGGEGICVAPIDFLLTEVASDEVDITWTMGSGATHTMIVRREGHYPEDRNDGTEVYYGTGVSTTDFDIDLESHTYYYRAWSYRTDTEFWSLDYAEGRIGGSMLLLMLFGFLAMGFTGAFLWKRYMLLGFGTAGMWALLGFAALQQSSSSGPAQITDTYMALFWLCIVFVIAFMLLPLVLRAKPESEDIYPEDLSEEDKPLFEEMEAERKDRSRLDILFGKVKKRARPSAFARTGIIKTKKKEF